MELAQLNYLLPRLTGHGVEMSRLGGGIGTRGPGETQLETDRRRIARRMQASSNEELEARARRPRRAPPAAHFRSAGHVLSLVGYTNAGKSTLFNRLTERRRAGGRRMFATLDPTVRALTLPSRRRVLVERHGRLHPQPADDAGEGVSRHARRGDRSRR